MADWYDFFILGVFMMIFAYFFCRDYSGSSNPGSVSHSSRNPPRYRNQPGI